MKKRIAIVMAVVVMALGMAGCGKEQDELLEYINGAARKEVSELETRAKDSYSSVSGDNYKDDETMLKELETNTKDLVQQVIDKATSLGEDLENEELKKVNDKYISSLKNFQSGVDKAIQALKDSDQDLANKANEFIDKANAEGDDYLEELKKLADKLGVELKLQDQTE